MSRSRSFEKSEFEITVDGVPHMIKLYDTAGQEAYDQLRKTIYKHVRKYLELSFKNGNFIPKKIIFPGRLFLGLLLSWKSWLIPEYQTVLG